MEKKESFYFSEDVVNGNPLKFEVEMPENGRIKEILCEFIKGENGDKKVKVYAINKHGSPIAIINGIGNTSDWLRGNGTLVPIYCDTYLEKHAKIVVESENDEPVYDYPLRVWVTVEY